jgi:hypothetical protein
MQRAVVKPAHQPASAMSLPDAARKGLRSGCCRGRGGEMRCTIAATQRRAGAKRLPCKHLLEFGLRCGPTTLQPYDSPRDSQRMRRALFQCPMGDDDSITEQRDLRTGTPLWVTLDPAPLRTHILSSSARADLLIAGAGITGALLAEAATARGLSVIVLDRSHLSMAVSPPARRFCNLRSTRR